MRILIAMWLARLEAAVLGRVVAAGTWLLSVVAPQSPARAALGPRGKLDDPDHRRHSSHTEPGLWWFAPRAAVMGWLIGTTAAAAHRMRVHPTLGHGEVAERRTG